MTTLIPHEREFLLGQQAQVRILATATETEGRHDLSDCTQPAGAWTPLHLHTRYDERFWVVAGSMTVWAGQDVVVLRSGDYYHVPRNVPHAIQAGPAGVRALQISTPAGFAEFVARVGHPLHLTTGSNEVDEQLFLAVAAEHGDTILGPPGTTPADLTRQ